MAPNHLTIRAPWTQHSIKRHAQQIRAACACRCVRHCEPSTPPLAPNARLYCRRCRPPLNGVRRQALLTTVCTKPSLYSRCRRCALANQIPRLSKCNKSFLLDRQRTTRNAAKTKMKSTVPNAMPSQQPPRRVLGAWHAQGFAIPTAWSTSRHKASNGLTCPKAKGFRHLECCTARQHCNRSPHRKHTSAPWYNAEEL